MWALAFERMVWKYFCQQPACTCRNCPTATELSSILLIHTSSSFISSLLFMGNTAQLWRKSEANVINRIRKLLWASPWFLRNIVFSLASITLRHWLGLCSVTFSHCSQFFCFRPLEKTRHKKEKKRIPVGCLWNPFCWLNWLLFGRQSKCFVRVSGVTRTYDKSATKQLMPCLFFP